MMDKVFTLTNAVQNVLNVSNWKPEKIRVDKSSVFQNRLMKLSLQGDAIKLCLIHNEEKPYVTKRFKVTGNKKVYIDKLDVSNRKYNNKYNRRTIKINRNINFDFEHDKNSKFKFSDQARISKYENVLVNIS